MRALIAKEIQLVVHPATYILMLLGALVLIPSWPYAVILLYGILIAFFNGLNAREGNDLSYSFSLPVSRHGLVRARVAVMMAIEVVVVAVMAVFVCLRIPLGINEAMATQPLVGLPANVSLLGFSLMAFGLFNAVFFPLYYRDPLKVGVPFILACIPTMVFGALFEAIPYLPFETCRAIGAVGFDHLGTQLCVLGVGIVAFAALGTVAEKLAARAFARYDA